MNFNVRSVASVLLVTGCLGVSLVFAQAQEAAPKTATPVTEPNVPPVPPPAPVTPTPPAAPVAQPAPNTGPLPADVIAWDGDSKEAHMKQGDPEAHFIFNLTNVSSGEVIVQNVHTSCGCTTAQLPPMPWTLPAGTNSELKINMNLAGKGVGKVFKTITFTTDKGVKQLQVISDIQAVDVSNMSEADRKKNQELAMGDAKAIFKGDCAACHVDKAKGKMGQELYAAACGICHDAEHRASIVPDLKNLSHETGRAFWKQWISYGKTGTAMPGFSEAVGGPLTEEQIASLADYLTQAIPSKVTAQN